MTAIKYEDPLELTGEAIAAMNMTELIENASLVFEIQEETTKALIRGLMEARAMELKGQTTLNRVFRQYDKAEQTALQASRFRLAEAENNLALKLDSHGIPAPTINNFLLIMENDPHYIGIHYNELKNAPEVHRVKDGILEISRWADADEAESKHYIEEEYKMFAENKHTDALRLLWRRRSYNPIKELIESLAWDGQDRCEQFLTRWAKADNTPYVREVSRLIFAGGIHRLYQPGCKFDDVPVLIGIRQGEGKSSLVKWLAINDEYFTEVKEIEGQRAIEQLDGAWICEVAELLALTKAKEQEAVKSYITTQRDKYRKPFDKNVTEYPRRCIFIGTTNNEQFLKDKTGNRRFYPVVVHSDGYWLHDHEQECRDYIIQCWAEARDKFKAGNMPCFADRSLLAEYQAAQEQAMEDDWRLGAIEAYLNEQVPGTLVCVRQIKREVLSANLDFPQDPTPKESQEIGIMMNKFEDWEKAGRVYTEGYGRQRCWRKKAGARAEDTNELPF